MRILIVLMLLCPAVSFAGDSAGAAPAAEGNEAPLPRPDAQKIMSELSGSLRLSSRQEDRISKAVSRKSRDFDDNMEEYEKNAKEEAKWRAKMDKNRADMDEINLGLPDLIREYLDDEQRQAFDNMLSARRKPAPSEAAVASPAPAADQPVQPKKKKRLVRRKKGAAGAAAVPAAGEAAAPAEDGDAAAQPAKKKRVLKKKAAAAPAPDAEADIPDEPAGAAPTGKEAEAPEEDAGFYP